MAAMDQSANLLSTLTTRTMRGQLPLAELCSMCEGIYTSYNAAATTPDTHMEEFLAKHRIGFPGDRQFICQVFYGMTRYKKLLHALIQGFYFANSSVASRSDITLFTLFAYFTVCRLKDLGFKPYRQLVLSQDGQKMLVLLHFLFNEEMLLKYCRDEWMKLYDAEYVEELIRETMSFLPGLDDMIRALEEKVYLSKKAEEEEAAGFSGSNQVTVPVPFNLSEDFRPLVVPEYQPPEPFHAQPAPPRKPKGFLNKEQREWQEIHERNHREVQEKYSDPAKGKFQLATDQRLDGGRSTLDKARRQAEIEFAKAHPFSIVEHGKPVPAPPTAHVRLNTAAILREDAVYKKKQAQEAATLKAYETELQDDSEYQRWKAAMLEKDEAARREEVERRRDVMEAEAQQAKELREVRETEKVRKMREEGVRIKQQLERERMAVEESNRLRRDIIVEARAGVKIAAEKLDEAKKERAAALMREKEEQARRLAEEKALLYVRKQELIRQLRAIEAVPISEVTKYDPTTTAGQGLLEEMSLAELKERVQVVQRRAEEEVVHKRHTIINNREHKEKILKAKAENISRIRDMANAQAALRREAKQAAVKDAKRVAVRRCEDDMLVLHSQLQSKHERFKEEQLRLAAEEKAIRFEQTKAAASAGAVEEKKFKELRVGQERELKVKQVVAKASETRYEKGKARTKAIRAVNLKTEQREKRDFIKEFDERLATLTREKETMLAEDLTYKRDMVATEHRRYEGMREKGLFITARTLGEKTEGGSLFLQKFLAEQEANKQQQ